MDGVLPSSADIQSAKTPLGDFEDREPPFAPGHSSSIAGCAEAPHPNRNCAQANVLPQI